MNKFFVILEWILTAIVLGCAITLMVIAGPTFMAGLLFASSFYLLVASILLTIREKENE